MLSVGYEINIEMQWYDEAANQTHFSNQGLPLRHFPLC